MINHKKKTKIQFFFQKLNHTRTWDCWQRPNCFHALYVSTGLTFRNKLSISGSTCTISKPKSNICHRCYITKFLCDLNKKIGVVKIKPPYLRFRICWEFTHSLNNFIAVREREREKRLKSNRLWWNKATQRRGLRKMFLLSGRGSRLSCGKWGTQEGMGDPGGPRRGRGSRENRTERSYNTLNF